MIYLQSEFQASQTDIMKTQEEEAEGEREEKEEEEEAGEEEEEDELPISDLNLCRPNQKVL